LEGERRKEKGGKRKEERGKENQTLRREARLPQKYCKNGCMGLVVGGAPRGELIFKEIPGYRP